MASTLDESTSQAALLSRIRCGQASDYDIQLYMTYQLAAILAASGGGAEVSSTFHTITTGTGNVPAGLQSVNIQLLAPYYDGTNEASATLTIGAAVVTLSNNPSVGRFGISFEAADFSPIINKKLPAMTKGGAGSIQWIGMSDNLT